MDPIRGGTLNHSEDPLDIKVMRGGRFVTGSVHRCLQKAANPHIAQIDLTHAQWVEPIGLVAIAAYCQQARQDGREIQLTGPANWSVANYLARMRLGHLVDSFDGYHDLNPVAEHETWGDLLELRGFTGERGVEELAEIVFDKLDSVDPVAAAALHTSIIEIGANVPQHSGCDSGYMAAQTTHNNRTISFAVGDAGVGLLQTLRASGAHTDEQALRLALEVGVTRTGEPGRGTGIRETRRLAGELRGYVHMVSGLASMTAHSSFANTGLGRLPFRGTLLQGRVQL